MFYIGLCDTLTVVFLRLRHLLCDVQQLKLYNFRLHCSYIMTVR